MADLPVAAISLTPRGMSSAIDPSLLQPGQVAKIVNGQLERQTITTRMGSRVIPVSGEWDRTAPVQGAVFYDPKRGVGAQVFSDDSASIFLAAGGRKGRVFIKNSSASFLDVTGEATQDASAHLIWMTQAENYLISGDGKGCTYIFDGDSAAYSTGFIGIDDPDEGISRDNSSVPQGATVLVYAHGRLWVVVDSRRILASDSLHGENLTTASDLLKFTEQVYWATGQFFVPPSSMGNVIAAAILPTRDTRTGQGEIMFHCQNGGIFSIKGNIYPREEWANSPMVNHYLLDTAAAGPYAIDIQEGDQLFRSRVGIQTLRSAAAESRLIGRPLKPISEEVGVWLDKDYIPYLRFASLINWSQKERLFCTVSPQVMGRHTYSKGLVSLNWDPSDSQQSSPSWEGLWTFPKSYRYISNMIRAQFKENERAFGLHFDGAQYSLVEYDPSLKCDVLECGTEKDIEMIVESREITGVNPFDKIGVVSGSLHLREISRTTKWKVDIRNELDSCWTKWRDGTVCIEKCPPDNCNLAMQQPKNLEVELGKPPDSLFRARRWQFRVTITGWARIEGLMPRLEKISDDNDFQEERLNVFCKETPVCCDDIKADFAYSDEGECEEEVAGYTSKVTVAIPPPPSPPGPPYVPVDPPDPPDPPDPEIPPDVLDDSAATFDLTPGTIKTVKGRNFDGASDHLSITDAAQSGLDFNGSPSMSLSFWATGLATQGGGLSADLEALVSKWTSAGNQLSYSFESYGPIATPGTLRFRWSHDGSSENIAAASTQINNALHMVTVTFSGAALKIYIDGVEDYSGTESNANIFNSTAPFEFGRVDGSDYASMNCMLAGAWSRALSATEITTLYNAGTPMSLAQSEAADAGLVSGLVSFWHMNEYGTQDAIDSVGGNDLTDINGTNVANLAPTPYPVTEGGVITHWESRSTGLSVRYDDAISTTNGPTLIGGKPTWDSFGTDSLEALDTAIFTQPLTVVVIAESSSVGADQFLFGMGFSGPRMRIDGTGTAFGINAGTEITGGTPDTSRHVYIAFYNGASSYLEIDGAQVASGDAGANGPNDLDIGTDGSGNNPWLGSIETVIVIARELTAGEKSAINLL